MTAIATKAANDPPKVKQPLSRLLSCIRFDEVIVLQGTPLIGACFTIGSPLASNLLTLFALIAGNFCLIAHVFIFNDWSGIDGDVRDPKRAMRTFVAKGLTRTEVGYFAASLLLISLFLFGLIGIETLLVAIAIAGLSTLYSAPPLHLKASPLFSSALHFVGGALHFLLGYTTFGTTDARALVVSCFFGLVFTAGHFMHEVRDCEVDLLNGIRTNAVAFGKTKAFVAGLALFIAAYTLLAALAVFGFGPFVLVLALALVPVHLFVSFRAMQVGLTSESLYRLQSCYRVLYALIGVVMIVMVPYS